MGLKFFKEASQRAAQAQALAAQNKKKKEDEERRKRNEQAKKRAEQKKKQQQQKSTLSKPTADTYKFDGNLKKYDRKVNTGNIKLSAPVVKQSVIQNEPVIQQKNSTVKDIASGIGRQLWGGYGKWAEGVNKAAYHGVKYIPGVGSAFKKAIDNQEAYNKANLEKGAEKIQKHLGNGFKSAAVNSLSQSAGQMIPDIVTTFMSAGTNRAASLAKLTADSGVSKWVKALKLPKESTPLFLSNLGNAYDDAIKNGANDGQALTSALINAYPQTVIEHSGGIQDLIKGKSKENVLKSIITSAIDEGKEELLQYPFEELSKLPYAPVTPYSSDPNEQAVINPKAQAQAAAVGALGGLVFGGVNTAFEGAANVAGKTVTGAKLKDFKQDIIDEGLNSPDGTYANDNALKLDNKKHVSLYDIGKQYELNVQQQENYKDGKYHTIPYDQPRKTIVPPSTEAEYKTQEKTVKKPVSTEFEGEVKEQQYEKTQQTVNVQAPIPDVRNASAVNGFPNDGVSQNSHDVNRAFTEFEALERAKYNETAKIKAVTPIYMQAKTLNSSQKRLVEDCRTLGIPVTFIEGTRVQTRGSSLNGAYYNGNIFINTSSENPYTVVAAHEVLHRIKDTDPEAYSQLCGIVDDALGKDNDFSGLGDYEKEEALADIMGDIIGEPKKYREVFRQKQNLLQRVIGYIRDMIARLTGKISGNFKNVSEFTESLKDAESKLTQIYKEAAGKTGSFEGETKYSDSQQHIYDYTKSFAEQVEDYKNGKIPERDSLLIGATPEVFKKIGLNSLPVTINQRHVDYALNGTKDIDHHIGEAMLSQLPEAIKDPVAVMRSQTNPNRIVALLEFAYNGKNIVAPFEIDGYGIQNSIVIDSNAIVSVYAKDNAISKQLKKAIQDEANGKISLFYLNKNKAGVLLQKAGLQLPGFLFQNNGFIHSIREKGANVNTRFENVTETQQFKRWFGDWQNNPKKASKVVNDDGTPKVVYHGSANKFTKFDYGKIGTSSGVKILGDSFYFSDNSGLAKGYGDNIYECYIDIKKPYYATEQDLYKIDVARLERLGYDGVILNTPKGEVYSVFNPNQIKSATDNIGTFDKNNPDIRYSKKAEAESDEKSNVFKFNNNNGYLYYIMPSRDLISEQNFKLTNVLTDNNTDIVTDYPFLRKTMVIFDKNSGANSEGYYEPETNTIHLARNSNNSGDNAKLILRHIENAINEYNLNNKSAGIQNSIENQNTGNFTDNIPQNSDMSGVSSSNYRFKFNEYESPIYYITPNRNMISEQNFKLADVLNDKNTSVVSDYPFLKDTEVVFDNSLKNDSKGYYEPETNTIHLAKNDNNFEKNSELILRHIEDIVNGGEKSREESGQNKVSHPFSTQRSDNVKNTIGTTDIGNNVSEGGINVNGSGEEVTKKQYNTYSIKELYTVRKHARISEAKAKKGVKFSDSDRAVIKEILKGNIDINSLNPDNINVEGIRRVIKFSQAVHDIEAEISKHKKSIAEERNSAAKKAIEGSDNWRDSKGNFFMSLNTMERNIKNIIPDSESANEVIENYIRPVSKSAADRVRYMDKMREKISNLKLTKDESYAVQFLGERRSELEALQNKKRLSERDTTRIELLSEELADFKANYGEYDNEKVNGAIKVFRETYNQIFEDMNNALIENGYDPVEYRRFYFPHFTDEGDSVLNKIARLAGLRSTIAEIPGDLTGRTQNFKPGKTFFTNALKRDGDTTSYDALTGFDKYIEGATDVIFQTKNIRNLRALTEALRYKYSKSGVKERINEIKNNDSLPPEEQQSLIDALYSDKNGLSKHNSLINELTEYTNLVANKRSSYDRKWEENWGRTTIYKLMGWAQKNIAGNMIQYNLSSAASNTVALQQASAEINAIDFIHGFFDTVKALAKDDGFNNKSDFLTNRQGSDPVSRSGYEKFTAATDVMQFSDMLVSGIIVRARYYENMRKHGMSETEALSEADNYANTVIAGRAKGEMPTRFAAKNPLTKSYTMFQLEVSNQLHNIFKDAPERILSRDGAWGLAKYITKYLFGAYLYNEIYEKIFGRRMALDPLGMIEEAYENFTGYRLPKTIGELNGEKESLYVGKGTTYSALLATSDNLLEQLPFFGSMLGGGRIPYAVAKPEIKNIYDAITGEGDGKKKAGVIISDGVLPLGYALNPFGGLNQLQKTVSGFNAVNNGVVTNTGGNVQYAVGQNPGNYVKGLLLGKSALPEAQRYYSGNSKPFSDKDTEEYNKRVANGESNLKVYADINERRKAKDAAEMVNPFIKNSANPSNIGIYKELGRLKQSGKNVEFEAPDTEFEVDGKTVKLDSYKYARYAREAATTAEKETANLFKSKHYAPIDDKEKVLSEVYSYAKALAKTKVSNYTLTPEHQKIKLATENGISAGEFIAIKQAMGDGPKSVNKVFDFARKNGYGEQESENLINLMTLTTDEYKRLYQRDGFKSGYRMHLLYYRAKQNGIDAKTCFVPIAKEDFSITDKKAGIKFSTTLSDKEISELQIVYNYYYEGALKSLDKMKFNNVQELYTATQKIRNKMLKSAKRDYYYYLKRTRQGQN